MKKKKINVILIIIVIIIVAFTVLGILYNVFDSRYAKIGVFDITSEEYVYEPIITMLPAFTLEGQPGTGAAGPYLYKPLIPMPVIVTVNAPGYKSVKKILFLVKGRESIVYLSRK